MLWSCKSFPQGYFHQKLSFAGSRSKSWESVLCTRKMKQGHRKRTGSRLEIAREHSTMHSSSKKAQNVPSVFLPPAVPSCSFLRWIILSCQNTDRGGRLISPAFLSLSWKWYRLWGTEAQIWAEGDPPSPQGCKMEVCPSRVQRGEQDIEGRGWFAGTKVSPPVSPAQGHGEGVSQHGCEREADDTNPTSRFETSTFFPVM